MAKRKASSAPIAPQVDFVSDFVCPWCWLGYAQFRAAAKGARPAPELTFRPYLLDPTVPDAGVDNRAYMAAKFGEGAKDKFEAARTTLRELGEPFGITFNFDQIALRPQSLFAHRLMRWVQSEDPAVAGDVAEAIFRAFHEQARDIGSPDVLADIAAEAGLDRDAARAVFDDDADKLAIMQEVQFFRGLGVSGVPTFIYNGQFAIQGAQPPDAHRKAFAEARKQQPLSD